MLIHFICYPSSVKSHFVFMPKISIRVVCVLTTSIHASHVVSVDGRQCGQSPVVCSELITGHNTAISLLSCKLQLNIRNEKVALPPQFKTSDALLT